MDSATSSLSDLQGNILRKQLQTRFLYAFVKFAPDRLSEALDWVSEFATSYVVSCSTQLSGEHEQGIFGNFYLSAVGYSKLGLQPPPNRSFRDGMKRANLNDPPLSEWESTFQCDLDAMISLGGITHADMEQSWIVVESLRDVCEVFVVEEGAELPGGVEHFGFVEGISQPLFLDEDVVKEDAWSAATPLQVVLAHDPYGAGDDSYGTYVVFRKLRQDVARFEQGIREMAHSLGVTEDVAGAMVIGRFKDGTPLALASESGAGPLNGFNYAEDSAGMKCPFASHVRRSNPRGELDEVSHAPDWQSRIARRGVPYGQPGGSNVGLLFVCYQSDIASQFELIQSNWCNFPHFPVLRVGRDPIIGQQNSWDHFDGQRWSAQDSNGDSQVFGFPQCVTMCGGEYFFAPSLSFLREMKNLKGELECSKVQR